MVGVTDDSTAKEFCTRKQYVDSDRSATTDRLLLNASYPYEGETLEALRLGSSSVERAFHLDRWKKEEECGRPSRAPRAFLSAPRKNSMRTALIVLPVTQSNIHERPADMCGPHWTVTLTSTATRTLLDVFLRESPQLVES